MSLYQELSYKKPFAHTIEETLLAIIHTGNLLSKEGQRVLRPFGLTDAQFNVLMLLEYNSGDRSLSQSELGRMLLVNRSNVTGLVDRMEKAGLVRRIADPADRRINQVQMTGQGRGLLGRAHRAYFSRIEQVMAGLADSSQKELSGILETVRSRLKDSRKRRE